MASEGSTYVADGALVMVPSNAEDLSTWMRRAHACRATSATEASPGLVRYVITEHTEVEVKLVGVHYYIHLLQS